MTSSRHKGSSSPDESDTNWLDDEDALQELYDHVADEEEEEEEEVDEEGVDPMMMAEHLGRLFGGGRMMSKRYRDFLEALQNAAYDPVRRLVVLQDLAEQLSIATEDVFLGGFPMHGLLVELLWTLGSDEPRTHPLHASVDSGDAELYACRCITYILEAAPPVVPHIASIVCQHGTIPLLITKLQEISYIDLAEQVLQTFEKLSHTNAAEIVREGGMLAMLQYLDFFGIHVQRTAMAAVANCAKVMPTHTRHVTDVVPIVRQVLGYSDARLVESACECVCHWLTNLPDEDALDEFLPAVCALLARGLGQATDGLPTLAPDTYARLLQALAHAARARVSAAHLLYEHHLLETVHTFLSSSVSDGVPSALAVLRDMLPPLPCTGIFDAKMYTAKAYEQQCRLAEREHCELGALDVPSRRLSTSTEREQRAIDARAQTQRTWPSFFHRYAAHLLPVLLRVYAASRALRATPTVLEIVLRTLWHTSTETLVPALEHVPLASFFAGVLTSGDTEQALQGVELLVTRLSYLPYLVREGVVHQVTHLADEGDIRAKLVGARLAVIPDDANIQAARDIPKTLRAIASRIEAASHADALRDALAALVEWIPRMTGFEMQVSGVLDALRQPGRVPGERRHALRDVLLPVHAPLLSCLHHVVSRSEDECVLSAGGVDSLKKRVQLRLTPDPATAAKLPATFHSLVVSVHAVVRIQSLHDFLRPKMDFMLRKQGPWHLVLEASGRPMPRSATLYKCVGLPDDAYPVQYRMAEREEEETPEPLDEDVPSYAPALELIRELHDLWESAVPEALYVNGPLSAKLAQQLDEPLVLASECLPTWARTLPVRYPCIFPFETRLKYMQHTALGFARLMHQYRHVCARDDTLMLHANMPRQKVRIARNQLLESAIRVLELYAHTPSLLEVEYFDEPGSGLGPTLEFYTLVSQAFQAMPDLWRGEPSMPLFPKPSGDASLFRVLGQFVAKSIVDLRMIDVPFHPLFWRAVLGRRVPHTLETLEALDAVQARSLRALQTMPADELERLELDGTLPGTERELVQGPLTSANINAYIQAVVDVSLHDGIAPQLDAFRAGFESVLSLDALRVFASHELSALFGQATEDWSEATLLRTIVPDHGFSSDSEPFRALLSILVEFDASERRTFLQWLTGAPRLPIGGFAALQPPFTVVRRQPEPPLQPDDYLPSVMTCVNYLKLPCYSSRDVMRQKLCLAMHEGLASFYLS